MARGAGTKLVGNYGFAHVGGGTRRGRGSCGCPPWPWPMEKGHPAGPWGSLSEGFRSWRCPMVWSFPMRGRGRSTHPLCRSQTSFSLSLSLSSTFCGGPLYSHMAVGLLSPRGRGAAGSHWWQWLPFGLGSCWEKQSSFKMRWHCIFLSQRGREGVGSFRNLLAEDGAIGGSLAHSLLPNCSEGKVPSGI